MLLKFFNLIRKPAGGTCVPGLIMCEYLCAIMERDTVLNNIRHIPKRAHTEYVGISSLQLLFLFSSKKKL
jgi:hypothetical protein